MNNFLVKNVDLLLNLKGIQHNITVKNTSICDFSDEEDDDDFKETCTFCKNILIA